jgi:hypothetical protein
VHDSRVNRLGWVVEVSQVKMNAIAHGGNTIRLQRKVNQAASAEDLVLTYLA